MLAGLAMWNLFTLKTQITVIVTLAAILVPAVGGLWAWVSGDEVGKLRAGSMVVSLIALIMIPTANHFWHAIWKWFPILGRKVFPDCSGRWEGELASNWTDPATQQQAGPIKVTIWIFQNLFSIHVRMSTGESSSDSTRCWIDADPATRRYEIGYTYKNRPTAKVSHRSGQHDGVAWLWVDQTSNPLRMTGLYCTTRHTGGDIDIRRISDDPDALVVHPTAKDAA